MGKRKQPSASGNSASGNPKRTKKQKVQKQKRPRSGESNRQTKKQKLQPYSAKSNKSAQIKISELKTNRSNKESLDLMMHAIADIFVGNQKFPNKLQSIIELLKGTLGKDYRELITGGNPDKECQKASEIAKQNDTNPNKKNFNPPGIDYKHKKYRLNKTGAEQVNKWNYDNVDFIIQEKGKSIKKSMKPTYKGECGNCWLCGLKVYYYLTEIVEKEAEEEYKYTYITSCGQCEHIGAIIASFVSGMLSSQDLPNQVYNYGTSHVHCNQNKSSDIPMMFDIKTGKWMLWPDQIKKIANNIVNRTINGQEYDPIFKAEFEEKTKETKDRELWRTQIKKNIEEFTTYWVDEANTSIADAGDKEKLKALALTKTIRELALKLMMKVNYYRKIAENKGGSPDLLHPGSLDILLHPEGKKENDDMVVSPHEVTPEYSENSNVLDSFNLSFDKLSSNYIIVIDAEVLALALALEISLQDKTNKDLLNNLVNMRKETERYEELNKVLKDFHTNMSEWERREELDNKIKSAYEDEINKAYGEVNQEYKDVLENYKNIPPGRYEEFYNALNDALKDYKSAESSEELSL